MSVSAVYNSTPAYNQQIGQNEEKRYDEIVQKAMAVSDSFNLSTEDNTEIKSFIGTAASVIMSIGISYIGGAMIAGKVSEAFNPESIQKVNGLIQKGAKKVANYVSKPLAKNSSKILNNLSEKLPSVAEKINFKHVAGVVSISAFVPKLTTVDGNNDGIKDITQKNVNAYKNAFQGLGAIADLLKAIG